MAFKMKYSAMKKSFPFKHVKPYPKDHPRGDGSYPEGEPHSKASHGLNAAIERGKDNDASGTTVTQPASEYIKVTQNQLDALVRNGKGDTPQAEKLKATIARLKAR